MVCPLKGDLGDVGDSYGNRTHLRLFYKPDTL